MRIKKWKVALGVMAVVALGTTTATATHVFDDLDDERFYAEWAEWAKDNGITVGCNGGVDFCGEDNVTRGENITFAGRYDANVVQPALDDLQDGIDDNASDIADLPVLYWASIKADGDVRRASSGVNLDDAETRQISTGRYEVDFTAVEDVATCQAMVTIGGTGSTAADSGMVYVEPRIGDESSIFVHIVNPADTDTDMPFEAQLWCDAGVFIPPIIVLDGPESASDQD